jgi:hypothetical protein
MSADVNPEDAAERRESLGGVLGIGLGLLILAMCVLAVLNRAPKRGAAAEVLAESFTIAELPGAFVLEEQAITLPAREQIFTFSDGSELEIEPGELVTSQGRHGGPGGEMGDFEEFDWSAVKPESKGDLPARFLLVRFPTSRAESILNSQFRGLSWRDLSELSAKGGSTVVGGDKLNWAGYSADWVRQRRFIEGGSFRDTMRVNLSLGSECWIGYAIWPELAEGSEGALSRLLDALKPVPSSEE